MYYISDTILILKIEIKKKIEIIERIYAKKYTES